MSRYYGRCPTCDRLHVLSLDHPGAIPPPDIDVACQCQVPVVMVRCVCELGMNAQQRKGWDTATAQAGGQSG